MTDPLVRVQDLERYFWEENSLVDRLLGTDPVAVRAVDGVSFDVRPGETLGLVGESGCGKSTVGETLLSLQEPTGGRIEYDGTDLGALSGEALKRFDRETQIVFQDPFASLDPRKTIGRSIEQPLAVHDVGTQAEREERVRDLLDRVGLSGSQYDRYPHEFSGGQRQRVCIARALALEPDFVVLDEPTSALDVSVQAQILNLLDELQTEFGLTYLLISHDLSVIRHICDRVAVMYLGEIVEIGETEPLFDSPRHPYTRALLESVPRASMAEQERRVEPLSGDVPSPRNPPSGCRFRTRCPSVIRPSGVDIPQRVYRDVMDLRELLAARDISTETIWDAVEGQGGRRGEDGSITGGAGTAELPVGETESGSTIAEDTETNTETDTASERLREPRDVNRENPSGADRVAFAERATERLVGSDLPPADRDRIETALGHVADGDWARASDVLETAYASVCERENPSLGTGEHPSACHLNDT